MTAFEKTVVIEESHLTQFVESQTSQFQSIDGISDISISRSLSPFKYLGALQSRLFSVRIYHYRLQFKVQLAGLQETGDSELICDLTVFLPQSAFDGVGQESTNTSFLSLGAPLLDFSRHARIAYMNRVLANPYLLEDGAILAQNCGNSDVALPGDMFSSLADIGVDVMSDGNRRRLIR